MAMEVEASTTHVSMVCSPGISHLIPFVQLANRVAVHAHNLSNTMIISSINPSSPAYLSLLETLPGNVNAITLPLPSPDSFRENTDPLTRIIVTTRLNLPQIRSNLKDLQSTGHLSALVMDMFSFQATEEALQLGIPCYRFIPCSFMMLSLCLHLPELEDSYSGDFKGLKEPVRLPGCVPITGPDLAEPVLSRSDGAYTLFIEHCKNLLDMKGILVNSFKELEPEAIKASKDTRKGLPPVYAVGPLVRPIELEPDEVQGHESLAWLDLQPDTSVVYVSFGSWGTLKPKQLTELAFGLEQCGYRFLWLVKESITESLDVLPEGFLVRTEGVGRVITSWAPQVSILKHKSVAAFMTHCGWGSTLEGITNSVPLIAFPLFAEQRMNAVLLTEGVKVSSRLKESESGLISRDEITRAVKRVMEEQEGKLLRERAAELRDAAVDALREGSSSQHAMAEVVEEWKKNKLGCACGLKGLLLD